MGTKIQWKGEREWKFQKVGYVGHRPGRKFQKNRKINRRFGWY